MIKAFLLDVDGVLANSENEWSKLGYDDLMIKYFGQELFSRVKINSGTSIKGIFDAFVSSGFKGKYEDYHQLHEDMAAQIYPIIALTPGIEDLIDFLVTNSIKVGIVSSSPIEWINILVSRLSNHSKISLILSVNNHPTLKPKPSPDPYLYAIKELNVKPEDVFILEDSGTGVKAGLASGGSVICFTEYHEPDKVLPEATYYAKNMEEVKNIVVKSMAK